MSVIHAFHQKASKEAKTIKKSSMCVAHILLFVIVREKTDISNFLNVLN